MTSPARSSRGGTTGTTLRRAEWPKDIETARRLFRDYRQWLADHRDATASADPGADIGLMIVDSLIAGLPGAYGPPRGDLILAFADDEVVALGALRELDPNVGEIKRIYVRADHRGPEFGPRLTQALLDRAAELGYERVRVDTLASMTAAIQFYQEMGFRPIPPYWPHPAAGALFFECAVKKPGPMPRRGGESTPRRTGSRPKSGSQRGRRTVR